MVNTTRRVEIWHFCGFAFTSAYLRQCFSNQLREKMPCQSFLSMVGYLPGAGKEAFRRAGNARFPRQGHTCGRSIWEDCQLPASGQARGNSFGREGAREVSAIAEAPCDGTDGRVPFVLPPRCPVSAMQPAGVVGSGRRDGTTRAPRCKRKTVKTLSPTLGIAGESPTRRGTLRQSSGNTN